MHMQRQVKNKKIGNKAKNMDGEVSESINIEREALEPTQEPKNVKTNEYFARIEETGLCETDQTRKVPL